MFNVPNNAEGVYFLSLLRKYRQCGNQYRIKGRGSRKLYGSRSDISQEHSEWMAVYVVNPKREEAMLASNHHWQQSYYQAIRERIVQFVENELR